MPQPNFRDQFAKLSLRFSFGNINNFYCQVFVVPAFCSMKLINFMSMILPIALRSGVLFQLSTFNHIIPGRFNWLSLCLRRYILNRHFQCRNVLIFCSVPWHFTFFRFGYFLPTSDFACLRLCPSSTAPTITSILDVAWLPWSSRYSVTSQPISICASFFFSLGYFGLASFLCNPIFRHH